MKLTSDSETLTIKFTPDTMREQEHLQRLFDKLMRNAEETQMDILAESLKGYSVVSESK